MEYHYAYAQILRIAEPQDPHIHHALEVLGAPQTAHILSGKKSLDFKEWKQALRTNPSSISETLNKSAEETYLALQERIQRWSQRAETLSPEQEHRSAQSLNSWICIPEDEDWPETLNDLDTSRPYALWGRGDRERLQELQHTPAISIVGSREPTQYGHSVTSHLVQDLAPTQTPIISGGALGIDGIAHRTALETSPSNLPTVALMACGVDRPYPKQHQQLLEHIINRGLLLSEVSLGTPPTRWRFLQRNRMIAALSELTVIVEARWRSGALNTAHHALELGRELRAVPGSIFSPTSQGCHRLLREGLAQPISCAQDIIDDLHLENLNTDCNTDETPPVENLLLTELHQRIWDVLPLHQGIDIEKISTLIGTNPRNIMSALGYLSHHHLAENTNQLWRKKKR
ncbi:DNA-processing protein DprA [Rothia sp. P13129]|uniref:DNA-processing protein DprA n=1 Tax=unclassified Rothia (in: high G+C Gram-positive bacteria) TaxID=2689056 RepID=UPI003AD520C3